jgi:hypothetical protein
VVIFDFVKEEKRRSFRFYGKIKHLIKTPNQRSSKMKRNFVFLLFAMLVLVFSNSLWAGQDPDDLGYPDSVIVLTCPDDHTYEAEPGSFDSVRVCVYVTHDSNTFWWEKEEKWIQDSLAAIVVPLKFWHVPEGCADSVIFPFVSQSWNNPDISPYFPWINRSMFRSTCGDSNRLLEMVKVGKAAWNVYTDVESHDGDSGHVNLNVVPMSAGCQRWWEGSRVLLATLTFHVYMSEACDTTKICFDSTFWEPNNLTFVRYDAVLYFPSHNLPVCDTVHVYTDVRWIEGSTDEESKPTIFAVSQNYPNPFNPVTNFRVALPQASHVKIEVFNILGQKMKTLVDEDMGTGVFVVDWDGKDDRGLEVSSGIYFYRIIAGDFSDIKKMVLLK